MNTTKRDGLTAGNSQPAKTHSRKLNLAIVAFPSTSGNCDKPKLIARLTRAGHLVHEGREHSFTVVHPRWGISKYYKSFAALVALARILEVKHEL